MDDATIDAALAQGGPIHIGVTREELEAADADSALAVLNLLGTAKRLPKARARVGLIFSGYDDDPRELPEVPEVRGFIAALDEAIPWLAYLLNEASHPLVMLSTVSPLSKRSGLLVGPKQECDLFIIERATRIIGAFNALRLDGRAAAAAYFEEIVGGAPPDEILDGLAEEAARRK